MRRIELVLGDRATMAPAYVAHAWVRTAEQAVMALALAAQHDGTDAIRWRWL